mmetsp:Transcript_6683/g.11938  ORF Transcript_6683/g.11938 Transcript_6683/m.11938 type:complete len:86 (+) Transcript_6683:1310-1567(+)
MEYQCIDSGIDSASNCLCVNLNQLLNERHDTLLRYKKSLIIRIDTLTSFERSLKQEFNFNSMRMTQSAQSGISNAHFSSFGFLDL